MELGVLDSLDDLCIIKKQKIKSTSRIEVALRAWRGMKRSKVRARKKIGIEKEVDYIQEKTIIVGLLVTNQQEEDLGVSSQNTIEAEPSNIINDIVSIPIVSANRTITMNELIYKFVNMDPSFSIRVDKLFSCNLSNFILYYMDLQTLSITI